MEASEADLGRLSVDTPEEACDHHDHVHEEAEVATGGLAARLAPAAIETGPVVGRFAELQAACSCASGCPVCIGVTAGSFVLPFVFRGRRRQTEDDQT